MQKVLQNLSGVAKHLLVTDGRLLTRFIELAGTGCFLVI